MFVASASAVVLGWLYYTNRMPWISNQSSSSTDPTNSRNTKTNIKKGATIKDNEFGNNTTINAPTNNVNSNQPV